MKQEGKDGLGSLTWILKRNICIFFLAVSEKNFEEFLYVGIVQVAPVH